MSTPSRPALWLGYAGLLPFASLAWASLAATTPWNAHAATTLMAYGASILSFMGAIHWGLAMGASAGGAKGSLNRQLVWGVIPSLIAWWAMLLPVAGGLWLVAAGLWACFAVDRTVYPAYGLRGWLPLRLVLTLGATACCGLVAWGQPL
jgi:hypothetical protein